MNSAGAGWIDYDNDGDWDLYLVNGDSRRSEEKRVVTNRLYRNNGNRTFTDVTEEAGVGHPGEGMGVAVGDYDNDGWDDLFVTNFGPNVLYRNNGDGTFTDVTRRALPDKGGNRWSTSAAWGDLDLDGDLDLYVANYVNIGDHPRIMRFRFPMQFGGEPNTIYRNEGNGRFTDITDDESLWMADEPWGSDANQKSMGVLIADINGDRWPDIYVANDTDPNSLYLSTGDGTLTNFSGPSGTSSNAGSMGIAYGDYDGDLRMDLYVTNYAGEPNNLYRQTDQGVFAEDFRNWQIAQLSWPYVGWGTGLFDFDLDGDLDLFVANGHLNAVTPDNRMFNFLGENREGIFLDVSGEAGVLAVGKRIYRSTAFADFDNDGRMDIYVVNNGEKAHGQDPHQGVGVLLRNATENEHHWLKIRLRGTVSNRNGFGTLVSVTTGGKTQVQELYSGGNYMASNARELVFGLGSAMQAEEVRIHWPSGRSEVLRNVSADQTLRIVEEGGG